MLKRVVVAVAGLVLAMSAAAMAQQAQQGAAQEFTPPEGVEFQIHLYPITKFRGSPIILTKSNPRIRGAMAVESILLTRGVWELCSDTEYRGRCVRISESRVGIPVAITTRSARLVGDTGPLFAETPQARPGPDVPVAPTGEITETRPAPAPVVAPTVEMGGAPGTNPSMAGREVEFYPAPARDGLRVLACAQTPNASTPRCAQATADGFCAERGYRDSGWRETEVIGGRTYLVNVLCKRAADNSGARSGIGIPFFGN